jgi:hypothetical protein
VFLGLLNNVLYVVVLHCWSTSLLHLLSCVGVTDINVAKEIVQRADVVEILWSFAFVFCGMLILKCGNSGLKDFTIFIDTCGI